MRSLSQEVHLQCSVADLTITKLEALEADFGAVEPERLARLGVGA
jgi:hypothetical protein